MAKVQTAPAAKSPAASKPAPAPAPASAPAAAHTETKSAEVKIDTGVDLTKLTPQQLAALQRQLKEKAKESQGDKKERFEIIDTMLQEKTDDGKDFRHTTRDIMNRLVSAKLTSPATAEDEQNEIKKIQARKQFLEKRRNEKGELMAPAGTYGYKAHAGGFVTSPAKIVEWFTDENVAKLTAEQKAAITDALS